MIVNKSSIINIRFAKLHDAHAIASIHIASWQKIYYGHIPDAILNTLSITEHEQRWHNFIKKDVAILILEKDNQIIGFASLGPSRDTDTDPSKCGEISAIYLHPDVWHQGLGKKLCSTALLELAKMGFDEVILWVLKENHQARKFYVAMGFVETSHTKIEPYGKDVILQEIRYRRKLHNE